VANAARGACAQAWTTIETLLRRECCEPDFFGRLYILGMGGKISTF
jgi:hypothetical protein